MLPAGSCSKLSAELNTYVTLGCLMMLGVPAVPPYFPCPIDDNCSTDSTLVKGFIILGLTNQEF